MGGWKDRSSGSYAREGADLDIIFFSTFFSSLYNVDHSGWLSGNSTIQVEIQSWGDS